MEILEYILIVLACVIASSVLERLTRHLALPLIQIIVGFLVAIILPEVITVHINSDLFLVLFLAPLLFNEARRFSKRRFWENKGAILSLAIGLVLASVLCVGFFLNLIVPSIPLAAAFACAAALSPTDAAAVSALKSRISIPERQSTILSGESMLNDASGIVSFQFALAAVITGSFSIISAGEVFSLLFFGGIAAGAAMGALATLSVRLLRKLGYEDTTIHVLYEVSTPFVVYLAAEWLGTSGILAVFAAGIVMAQDAPRLTSIYAAQHQSVSDTFWKIIVYLINGLIFVMLGMQLPLALFPAVAEKFSVGALIAIVLAVTFIMIACRFLWIFVLELIHKSSESQIRGIHRIRSAVKDSLVMTLAGPKGAVTLSIIFTTPIVLSDGQLFPERGLIIFLTAGVILTTLLLANFVLPLLAPARKRSDELAVQEATITVLEKTLEELQRRLDEGEPAEYIPALRQTEARYQTRLAREREQANICGSELSELSAEILRVQQERADELQSEVGESLSASEGTSYYADLRNIRASVGYTGSAVNIGSHPHNMQGKIRILLKRTQPIRVDDEKSAQIYYDSCLFAIELERAAIDYLNSISENGGERSRAADALIGMHEAAIRSIRGRINYGQDEDFDIALNETDLTPHKSLPIGMKANFSDQFSKARQYAHTVDSNALIIELDHIRHMEESGEISGDVAHKLRQRVYILQGGIEAAETGK